MKTTSKRGQAVGIQGLPAIAIAIGVVAVVSVVMLAILSGINAGFTPGSLEANATVTASTGISNLLAQLPLIGTIVGLLVLFVIAVGAFSRQPAA